MVWTIWNHRNDILFRGVECDIAKMVNQCKFKAWIWLRTKDSNLSFFRV